MKKLIIIIFALVLIGAEFFCWSGMMKMYRGDKYRKINVSLRDISKVKIKARNEAVNQFLKTFSRD